MNKEFFNKESALAKLLLDDVVFCDTQKYVDWAGDIQEETIVLLVICNDVFSWASADAECLTEDELPDLYNMHIEDPLWGSIKWVCKKRNLQPQDPMIEMMKKEGVWDDMMENLPKQWRIKLKGE